MLPEKGKQENRESIASGLRLESEISGKNALEGYDEDVKISSGKRYNFNTTQPLYKKSRPSAKAADVGWQIQATVSVDENHIETQF